MKYYMVFDGRFHYDQDSASILECVGESDNEKDVKASFIVDYNGFDAVLVSYDFNEKDELSNPNIVY